MHIIWKPTNTQSSFFIHQDGCSTLEAFVVAFGADLVSPPTPTSGSYCNPDKLTSDGCTLASFGRDSNNNNGSNSRNIKKKGVLPSSLQRENEVNEDICCQHSDQSSQSWGEQSLTASISSSSNDGSDGYTCSAGSISSRPKANPVYSINGNNSNISFQNGSQHHMVGVTVSGRAVPLQNGYHHTSSSWNVNSGGSLASSRRRQSAESSPHQNASALSLVLAFLAKVMAPGVQEASALRTGGEKGLKYLTSYF